jgi:uncharacterized protein YjbI with pentapeptide repeats
MTDEEKVKEYLQNGSIGKFILPSIDSNGADPSRANLYGADLKGANLSGILWGFLST